MPANFILFQPGRFGNAAPGPSLLLLKVSGVALLERDIADRRPAYRAYVARTNAFVPGWPREEGEGR